MSRPLRKEFPGALYHLIARGNERREIFSSEHDRHSFLYFLSETNHLYDWVCHSYCLMNNHYHLLIETNQGNLSQGMRDLNGLYAQNYNRTYKRNGHLFEGRYKALLVEKDSYLLEVSRYIVLNPVKAKMIKNPEEWEWSSYQAMTGLCKPHPALTTSWILNCFHANQKTAMAEYKRFVLSEQTEQIYSAQGVGRPSCKPLLDDLIRPDRFWLL